MTLPFRSAKLLSSGRATSQKTGRRKLTASTLIGAPCGPCRNSVLSTAELQDRGISTPLVRYGWTILDKQAPTVGLYRYLQFGVNKILTQPAIEYSVQQKIHSQAVRGGRTI